MKRACRNSSTKAVLSLLIFLITHPGCFRIKDDQPPIMPHDKVQCIIAIAKRLEKERLIFSHRPADKRDCSGIFHRLMDILQLECGITERPPIMAYRSSRAIAAWYAKQGTLTIVNNPLHSDYLIRPGTVMFYGEKNKRYRFLNLNTVLTNTRHIGIVIAVHTAQDGSVKSYDLFHGRSPKKPAAITSFHVRQPLRSNYPPLGNGCQPWIACSPLITPQFADNYSMQPLHNSLSVHPYKKTPSL